MSEGFSCFLISTAKLFVINLTPAQASPRLYVLNLSDGRLSRLGGNTPDKDVKDVQYNAAAQLLCFVFREPFGDESPMGMFYSFNRPSVLYVLPRKDFAGEIRQAGLDAEEK